jgi:hypothetical protein
VSYITAASTHSTSDITNVAGRILSGESGSLVFDSTSRKVYGHVVGSDALGHAHVAPLAQVLEQLRSLHDCNVEMAPATWLKANSKDPSALLPPQTTPEPSAAIWTVSNLRGRLPEPRGNSPKSTQQIAFENKTSSFPHSKDREKATRILLGEGADVRGDGGEQGTIPQAASSGSYKDAVGMVSEKVATNSFFDEAEKVRSPHVTQRARLFQTLT